MTTNAKVRATGILVATLITTVSGSAAGQITIANTAAQVVSEQSSGNKDYLVFIDAAWPELAARSLVQDLSRLRGSYVAETARTDKQLGSSASAGGTTTVAQKAGIPSLLAFAVEHGAVQRETSGTNITFTTSPYALLTVGLPDTPDNITRYAFWRRWGLSASFPLEDTGSGFEEDALSEISVRFRVLGDRSSRASKSDAMCRLASWLCPGRSFQEGWVAEVQPLIQERINAETKLIEATFSGNAGLQSLSATALDKAKAGVNAAGPTLTQEAVEDAIEDALRWFSSEVAAGSATLTPSQRQAMSEAAATLAAIGDPTRESKKLQEVLDEVNSSPLVTLEYTDHRRQAESDFSEIKLLAEYGIAPVDFVFNAGVSLLHDPDKMTDQSRVRDYSVSVSIERQIDNFLPLRLEEDDLTPITLAFSGRFVRMEDADDQIGVGQFRINIPVAAGVSLPVSVTYATRTELIDESELRGNFGFTLDTDKLYAMSRPLVRR